MNVRQGETVRAEHSRRQRENGESEDFVCEKSINSDN